MDFTKEQFDFISNMTNTLIWPLVGILFLFYFRDQVRSLIGQLRNIKVGNLEAEFQDLPVSSQSLIFLDGIARKDQWTFYEKRREGERSLGAAFLTIAKDLLDNEKVELIKKLNQWLGSKDTNLIWFASEIIGYFKVKELEESLYELIPRDKNVKLDDYQLNCIWAHSRLTSMDRLSDFLMKTKNEENQIWTLFVYKQMPNDYVSHNDRKNILKEFMSRMDITDRAKNEADNVLSSMS